MSSHFRKACWLSNFSTLQNVTSNTATVPCNPLVAYVINNGVTSVFTHCLSSGVQTSLDKDGVMQQLDCSGNDWQAGPCHSSVPASNLRSCRTVSTTWLILPYTVHRNRHGVLYCQNVTSFNRSCVDIKWQPSLSRRSPNPPPPNSTVCTYQYLPTEPTAHTDTHLRPSKKCGLDWVVHHGSHNRSINIRGHLLYRILSKSDIKCTKRVYLWSRPLREVWLPLQRHSPSSKRLHGFALANFYVASYSNRCR